MEAATVSATQAALAIAGVGVSVGAGFDIGRFQAGVGNHHHQHVHQHVHHRHHPSSPLSSSPHNHHVQHRHSGGHPHPHIQHYRPARPAPFHSRGLGHNVPRARAPPPRPILVADAPPQLPPLVISPHWQDASSTNDNNGLFVAYAHAQYSPSLISTPSPSPHEGAPVSAIVAAAAAAARRPHQPRSGPHSRVRIIPSSSLSEPRHDPQTPQSPAISTPPYPLASGPDAHYIDNFSRPRKFSARQQQPPLDLLRTRKSTSSTIDPLLDTMSLHTAEARSRGPSISSIGTASTVASAPLHCSPGFLNHQLPVTRPPILFGRNVSGQLQDMPALVENSSAGDFWSSSRTQLARSWSDLGRDSTDDPSLVKHGLGSSLAPPPDEPSVEDVMSLYETGFNDTEPEEHDDFDSRPQSAWSAPHRASQSMLSAPINRASILQALATIIPNHHIDETFAPYRAHVPTPPSEPENNSIPDDRSIEKRDSGKSLDSDVSDLPKMQKVETEDPNCRDRYGFKKENQYILRHEYDRWNAGYDEYLARRKKKWVAYLKENSLMTNRPNRFPPRNNKTKRFVRKGIPPNWRGAAWFYYAGGPAVLSKNAGVYERLLKQDAKEIDVEAIERDLHRTFPDNIRFKPPSGGLEFPSCGDARYDEADEVPIITSLRRVLLAFSIYNPRIGYCQSLNFLAGLLLLFVESEVHCFWLLNIITRDFLPGTHEHSLEGSKVDLGVLMTSLHESMPAVWAKIAGDLEGDTRPQTSKSVKKSRLRRKDIPPPSGRLPPITLCMTAWFMSCFIGTLPIETTLRVWDVLFYEGSKTLFRIALAIFKTGENEIQAMLDPMEMYSVVQTIPRRMLDANALMDACYRRRNGFGHLSQETTEQRRKERRVQLEKDAPYDGAMTEAEVAGRKGSNLFSRRKKTTGAPLRRPIDE